MTASEPERVRAILDACHDDPALFGEAVLGVELWSGQKKICDSVARYPITIIPGGRGIGKSFVMAVLVLWWLFTRPYSLVITTGPDHRQVVTVLWKEIRRALKPKYDRKTGRQLTPRIKLGYDHLTQGHGSPQRLTILEGTEWQALGFACSTDEGLSGQHAGEMLVIVDEASGVKQPIWTSIHGLIPTRLVIPGNPIKYDCHFRELWDLSETSETINGVQISSLESPDADKPSSKVGMASKTFLDQMREIHGEGSPWWLSNIEAQFPGKESALFFATAWLDACTRPEILDDPEWLDADEGPAVMGIDPSGGVGADRSTIVIRNRKRILEIFSSKWHGLLDDAKHRLEPEIFERIKRWNITPGCVYFDKNGLGRSLGAYLAKGWGSQYPPYVSAVGYFGSGKGGPYYVNRRTATAFAFRNRIDARRVGHVPFYIDPAMPEWHNLRRELMEIRTPVMEFDAGKVKQKLETKDELKARLKFSPDISDAFFMTYHRAA